MNWRTSPALWGIRIMWFAGGVALGLGDGHAAPYVAVGAGILGFVLLGLGWKGA